MCQNKPFQLSSCNHGNPARLRYGFRWTYKSHCQRLVVPEMGGIFCAQYQTKKVYGNSTSTPNVVWSATVVVGNYPQLCTQAPHAQALVPWASPHASIDPSGRPPMGPLLVASDLRLARASHPLDGSRMHPRNASVGAYEIPQMWTDPASIFMGYSYSHKQKHIQRLPWTIGVSFLGWGKTAWFGQFAIESTSGSGISVSSYTILTGDRWRMGNGYLCHDLLASEDGWTRIRNICHGKTTLQDPRETY